MLWPPFLYSLSFNCILLGYLIATTQFPLTNGHAANFTIDDAFYASEIIAEVAYDTYWVSSTVCESYVSTPSRYRPQECGLDFDRSRASYGTWHALLGRGDLSIIFRGKSLRSALRAY